MTWSVICYKSDFYVNNYAQLKDILPMKFFIDTADVEEIRDLNDTGLVDGVTTNPSLIMKSGKGLW